MEPVLCWLTMTRNGPYFYNVVNIPCDIPLKKTKMGIKLIE